MRWSNSLLTFARFMSVAFITLVLSTRSATASSIEDRRHPEKYLFGPLIIPLAVVYCCWLVPALAAGSPRYVFDSVIQYVLLLPTRINIVTLNAFCNIHDISWGTKGSDRAFPLPSVSTHKFGNVSVDIPGDDAEDELDNMYERAQQLLRAKENMEQLSFSGDHTDITFKQVRTLVVASWALSNGLLIFLILNYMGAPVNERKVMKFVAFILWSFSGLTGIKTAGALYHFVTHGKWIGDGDTKSKKRKTT